MTATLRVEKLSISSGTTPIVKEVSFTLNQGEALALIGPSGAGKSLTAQAAANVLPRTLTPAGSVSTNETISYLPQDPIRALDPLRSIGWHLQHARPSKAQLNNTELQGILERVGLQSGDILSKHPHEISGGMARRITIAQCLLAQTVFVIVDEPTNGIDADGVDDLMHLFDQLVQNGAGILLITHDLPLAMHWCNRAMLLEGGTRIETLEGQDWKTGQFTSPVGKKMVDACRTFGVLS